MTENSLAGHGPFLVRTNRGKKPVTKYYLTKLKNSYDNSCVPRSRFATITQTAKSIMIMNEFNDNDNEFV